jgi:predicted ATPase
LSQGVRLLTLTGPGGVGKTRLALAVAAAAHDNYRDGATFVDLSPLRNPELVASTIARALGLREEAGQGPRALISWHLRDRAMLLLLDNFEQVIAAATLVAEMIASCPRIVVLATSRVALHVQAEHRFAVRPLPTHIAHPGDSTPSAAVRLFAARAQAALPSFSIDDRNKEIVAEICRRLDGLPLAIVLAAARIKLLPPGALLARLERRLPLLTSGARDLPERQQTLRATIDWSYALLTTAEQSLTRRLSVFVGGCTLGAAESVAAADEQAGDEVLSSLETLADHGLIRAATQPGQEPRFQMPEIIREYGLEQLAAAGEVERMEAARDAYYLTAVEGAGKDLFGPRQLSCLRALDLDYDNVRAALNRVAIGNQARLGVRWVGALWRYWYLRCLLAEGRAWLDTFAPRPDAPVPSEERIAPLVGLAVIAYAQTDYEGAQSAAEQSVALARDLDDQSNLIIALNILGGTARHRGDFHRAGMLGEESIALARSTGSAWTLALSLNNAAEVKRFQGQYGDARSRADESMALARAQGDRWGVAQALLTEGRIARDLGDFSEAAAQFEEALAVVRALGHTRDIALALAALGDIARANGDVAGAEPLLEEGLALARPLGDRIRTADILVALADLRSLQSRPREAPALLAESLALYLDVGNRLGLATVLERTAIMAASHHPAPAAGLLAAAGAIRDEIGAPLPPAQQQPCEHATAAMRERLGADAFDRERAAGRRLTDHQAVSEAQALLAAMAGAQDAE